MATNVQLVWFKRDLRLHDHAALTRALLAGPVIPLYILEPKLWAQPDMSQRQYEFLQVCVADLEQQLSTFGVRLLVKVGGALNVLTRLAEEYSVAALWSHQETWNHWTYERDQQVANWCKDRNIVWHQPSQNGVRRGLKRRSDWARYWYQYVETPQLEPVVCGSGFAHVSVRSDVFPRWEQLGFSTSGPLLLQAGGRAEGLVALNSFLEWRGRAYSHEMSSPVSAYESCSRLSPHLAFGTVSIREVYQATQLRLQQMDRKKNVANKSWYRSLRSFLNRLRWHCHFIQKLEDEPRLEFENLHPCYDVLRADAVNADHIAAWAEGRTGYPMIDACMRALSATGWLNFRMRAMLVSFASYHLWLHWREPALHLARLFTDYEPGIHYSQVQMQSGTTGINAIRIYNPVKQGLENDPGGEFVRRWVPELRSVDTAFIHTPWLLAGGVKHYPAPIVDEQKARAAAAQQVYALRRNNEEHRRYAEAILKRHATKREGRRLAKSSDKAVTKQRSNGHGQMELPF